MKVNKFRIYDTSRKEWVHGNPLDKHKQEIGVDCINLFGETIIFGELLRRQSNDTVISIKDLNNLVAVQYIGASDANGLDIYEGDILRAKNGTLLEVMYDTDILGYVARNSAEMVEISSTYLKEFEIAGNKFDNPEMHTRLFNK